MFEGGEGKGREVGRGNKAGGGEAKVKGGREALEVGDHKLE
jgi:hypothetical protein